MASSPGTPAPAAATTTTNVATGEGRLPDDSVRRKPERGTNDRDAVNAVLDATVVGHVGVIRDGWPVVMPTIHARDGGVVYLHGSPAAGVLRDARRGVPVCLTVSVIDGVVLARSARNHSLNYRSAVVFGRARQVADADAKRRALRCIVERVAPGRWGLLRPMTDEELRGTEVTALEWERGSAKVRTGPSRDPEQDRELPVWAGLLPLRLTAGPPEPDAHVPPGIHVPDHVLAGTSWWAPGA